jgi:hypothetical protein
MTSDNDGRIWLRYNIFSGSSLDDLYVFDGISSRQFLYNGERLKNISDIAFDKQNHLWIVDRCGNIGEFTDLMETYPKEITAPELQHESNCSGGSGMYIDDRERIWLGGSGGRRMFENGTWMTLTLDNSGLVGDYYIYDLVVDDLDRVWILSDRAIHMIPVKDIQTLPQELVDRWNRAMSLGYFLDQSVFILPIELVLVWVMALINLNVRQGIHVTDTDDVSIRKLKQLAKTSLAFGNVSFGSIMLRLSFGIEGIDSEILGYLVFPLLILLVVVGSLVNLIAGAAVFMRIRKENIDSDNLIKKIVYQSVILSIISIALLVFILVVTN